MTPGQAQSSQCLLGRLIWVLDENDLVFGEHRGRVKEPGAHDGHAHDGHDRSLLRSSRVLRLAPVRASLARCRESEAELPLTCLPKLFLGACEL